MPYLTPAKVREVRELLAAGNSLTMAAKRAGCGKWVVNEIRQGRHRPRYRNPKRYASQDAWKRRLPAEERAKVNGRSWRCSCGLLVRTRRCRRCELKGD